MSLYLPIKCVFMRLEGGNEPSEMAVDYSYLLANVAGDVSLRRTAEADTLGLLPVVLGDKYSSVSIRIMPVYGCL